MKGRISVQKSQYSEEFDGEYNIEVSVLSKEEAILVWNMYIDSKAASFFNLPDNNWIIASSRYSLGDWLKEFNSSKNDNVKSALSSEVQWNDGDIIWYCISKFLVLESTWKTFKDNWINFLSCEDDCPIIINKNCCGTAILFRPIGDFIKIRNK